MPLSSLFYVRQAPPAAFTFRAGELLLRLFLFAFGRRLLRRFRRLLGLRGGLFGRRLVLRQLHAAVTAERRVGLHLLAAARAGDFVLQRRELRGNRRKLRVQIVQTGDLFVELRLVGRTGS